jgi:Lhr-like helicase
MLVLLCYSMFMCCDSVFYMCAMSLLLIQASQKFVRMVGLSATLPNYKDVAAFLQVRSHKYPSQTMML